MKFFLDNLFFIALALASGGALLLPTLRQRGRQVSLLQATQMINQGKTAIVDVRPAAQFATGHLREARNIPLAELADRVKELDRYKSGKVIVVCQSGTQSARATLILNKAGFNEVYGLSGGIAAWQAQGLPVTKQAAI